MATEDVKVTDEDRAVDVKAVLSLCGAATPGPWRTSTDYAVGERGESVWAVVRGDVFLVTDCDEDYASPDDPPPNLAFMAAARTALPALCRRLLAAEAENARLRACIQAIDCNPDTLTPEEAKAVGEQWEADWDEAGADAADLYNLVAACKRLLAASYSIAEQEAAECEIGELVARIEARQKGERT